MPSKSDKVKATPKVEETPVVEEKKVVLNKETLTVGLNFNVKKFKDWLKSHYNQVHNVENVKVMNAHYLVATVDEVVMFNLLTAVSHLFSKEKTGLQDLTLERFRSYILTTPNFRDTFYRFLERYDDQLDYAKQLCVERTKFDDYVVTHCFHKNNNIHLNKDTRNFLCFLLVQLNINLANTAFMVSKHMKKTTVNAPMVRVGIELVFSGKLLEDVSKKVEEVETILKNKTKQDSDKDVDKSEKKKTSVKDAKETKQSKQEDEDEEEEDGEDEDDDDDDDEDEDDDEDDDDEEEEVVKAQAKTTKPKPKSGKGSVGKA